MHLTPEDSAKRLGITNPVGPLPCDEHVAKAYRELRANFTIGIGKIDLIISVSGAS